MKIMCVGVLLSYQMYMYIQMGKNIWGCLIMYHVHVVTALLTWLLPLHFVWLYSKALIDAMVFSCIAGTVYVLGIAGTELSAY